MATSPTRAASQAELEREDEEEARLNQLATFENLLRAHANLIQNTNAEVQELKKTVGEVIVKVISVDDYAQKVDERLTKMLTGVKNHYDPLIEALTEKIGHLEVLLQETREGNRLRANLAPPVPPGIPIHQIRSYIG